MGCFFEARASGANSQRTYGKGVVNPPLTAVVTFKTRLQKGNRAQVPKLIRWSFKMDNEQVLKASVTVVNVWTGWQFFYAKMGRDGRIVVPKLTGFATR